MAKRTSNSKAESPEQLVVTSSIWDEFFTDEDKKAIKSVFKVSDFKNIHTFDTLITYARGAGEDIEGAAEAADIFESKMAGAFERVQESTAKRVERMREARAARDQTRYIQLPSREDVAESDDEEVEASEVPEETEEAPAKRRRGRSKS